MLVALSIDRLDAIARPMSFSGSGKSYISIEVELFRSIQKDQDFYMQNIYSRQEQCILVAKHISRPLSLHIPLSHGTHF